jgi:hypothetical protein
MINRSDKIMNTSMIFRHFIKVPPVAVAGTLRRKSLDLSLTELETSCADCLVRTPRIAIFFHIAFDFKERRSNQLYFLASALIE